MGRERVVQDGGGGSGIVDGVAVVVDKEVENLSEVVVLVLEILGSMIGGVMEDVPSVGEEWCVSVEGRPMSGVVNDALPTTVDEAATGLPILLDSPLGLGTRGAFSTRLSIKPILFTPGG